MQKERYLNAAGLFYIFILIVFLIVLSLSRDTALFKTDFINLIHYILGIQFLLFFLFLLPFSILYFICQDEFKKKITTWLVIIICINLLFGFLITIMDLYLYRITSKIPSLISLLFLLTLSIISILKYPNKNILAQRLYKLSGIITLLGLSLTVLLTGFRHLKRQFSTPMKNRKNVVFIVMDAMSTKYLPIYNPKVKNKDFTEIVENSILYMNIYTDYTYTHGYFGVFYSGNKTVHNKPNLLSLLQQQGIQTRYSVFHINGVPDANQIYHYKGLRSLYLNERLSWLPRLFGINYNFIRNFRESHAPLLKKLIKKFSKLYNPTQAPLENHIIDEIKYMRKSKRPFFLILHTNARGETVPFFKDKKFRETDLWKKIKHINKESRQELTIRSNDFTYTKKHEKLINRWRMRYIFLLQKGLKSLNQFFHIYKQKGWDKDTILIITADHGKIYSKGKVWYIYHNEEEVTRVPFIIHDGINKGKDTRLGESIDITQTILDIFQVKKKLSPDAFSLIKKKKNKIVSSLTDYSKKRNEQWLNIYQQKNNNIFKYIINLKKNDYFVKTRRNGFDSIVIEKGPSVTNHIDFNIKEVIASYGLNKNAKK